MTSGRSGAGLGLVGEAAGFRRLFLATFASSIGTWLAFVALVVDVYDRTGDANWVSALLIADFLPIVLVGILLGPLIDRLPRRNILVAADILRAGVFCVLPFATSAAQIVGLALIIGIATSLFRPAVFAGLPNLVADDDLGHANGILQSAENFAWAVGALAGGALVAASGSDAAYWLNAGTFVVSAFFILGIRQSLEEGERAPSAGHRRDLAEGLRMVTHSRGLLTILVAWSIVTLGQAIGNVSEIVLAKEEFDAGDFGYGVLVATAAVGLTLGSLAGGGLIERFGIRTPYVAGVVLLAFGFGAAAVSPNVWVAAVFVIVSGLGNGAVVVCNAVLVQRGAPDRLRGRAFTVVMSIGYAFFGLGMIVAGPLTNGFGARTAWGISAVLCSVAACFALVLLSGVEERHSPAVRTP
ncbi:MAG TPA: MFS transporter [Gaiellaceae bacterium]|nr:MFS transporter [Gaiellaceae bacterium]